MDMSASYKPVMLLAILDCADAHGRARLADVVGKFRRFYEARREAGLSVEKANARMAKLDSLEEPEVQRVLLDMPFEKFERAGTFATTETSLSFAWNRACGDN